jgi:hypothetical protein
VCDALRLEAGDYSFAYVARWSNGATEVIRETGERVIRCAKAILQGLEERDRSSDAASVA